MRPLLIFVVHTRPHWPRILPADSEKLGEVQARDRDSARAKAQVLYGLDIVVQRKGAEMTAPADDPAPKPRPDYQQIARWNRR